MGKIEFQKNCLIRRSVKFFNRNTFNFRNLNKILFVFIIILGIFYIAGVNDLTVKGFILSDLKVQYGKIADENKKLELRAMTLSSYGAISEKINDLEMVAVGNIDYINNTGGIVAKR